MGRMLSRKLFVFNSQDAEFGRPSRPATACKTLDIGTKESYLQFCGSSVFFFVRRFVLRVLSGIQPSGRLHIGNYFGAMRQHIQMQQGNDCFFFIADYHALTSNPSPKDVCRIHPQRRYGLYCPGS